MLAPPRLLKVQAGVVGTGERPWAGEGASTMRRKTFDALLTTGGLVLAAVLIVAGALLTWAHTFVHNEVRSQLAQQQIFIPKAGSPEIASPQISPYLSKYAGQQLLTGPQAKAYADHYINVHLQKIGGGQTYSQLRSEE